HRAKTGSTTNDLIERHAWLADAYFAAGDMSRSLSERLAEEHLLDALLKSDPKNMDLRDTWCVLQRALAKIEQSQGRVEAARARLQRTLAAVDDMIRFDTSNSVWTKSRTQILENLKEFNQPDQGGNRQ